MKAADKLADALKRRKGIEPGARVDPSTRRVGYGSQTGPTIARLKQELRSARAAIKQLSASLAGARERAAQAEAELRQRDAELDAEHRKSAGTPWRFMRVTLRRIAEYSRRNGSAKGVSIKSCAAAIRVCPKTMRHWLSGYKKPDRAQVARIAAWLRSVDLQAFFDD